MEANLEVSAPLDMLSVFLHGHLTVGHTRWWLWYTILVVDNAHKATPPSNIAKKKSRYCASLHELLFQILTTQYGLLRAFAILLTVQNTV